MAQLQSCYACRTVVPPGVKKCPTCGADQSALARQQHQVINQNKKNTHTWKMLAIVAGLIAFISVAWASLQSKEDSPPVANQPSEQASTQLSLPEVTDAFIRIINKHFSSQGVAFEILGWLPLQSGGIVMELKPPTPEEPLAFWQAITVADRQKVMTFLSVTYTKMLLEAGVWPEGAQGAFPVMALQYRGMSSPLAVRLVDGQIKLYTSPYDSLYAPLLEKINQASPDQPQRP